MNYGKNLTWLLSEVSLADTEQFETGSIEIIGENNQGQEGSTEVEIPDLALAAKNRIESLQHALAQICDLAARPSGSSIGDRPDIIARAKESLEHQILVQKNILMSAENPTGHKLEELLIQLQNEINDKNNKIISDQSDLSLAVQDNNLQIMKLLNQARNLQVNSFELMAKKAPDNGPSGEKRIG
jgi:hypothetical protein